MQSPAAAPAAIRGTYAAGAALTNGLKTFSRRSKLLSQEFSKATASMNPPPLPSPAAGGDEGSGKTSTLADGKLNFRVRKRRQPISVTSKAQETGPVAASSSFPSTGEDLADIASLITTDVETSPSVIAAVVSDTKTGVKRQSARILKRAAEAEQTLEVTKSLGSAELLKSSSRTRTPARRVSRKNAGVQDEVELGLPPPTASIVQDAATPDFWHSSLSEKSSAGGVIQDLVEGALLPIIQSKTLTAPEDLAKALEHLKSADPLLKGVIEMHDAPKFEKCDSAFAALARSIVFQQLATKAASAIFGRLVTLCEGLDNLTPGTISQFSAQQLRAVGLSERKASYLHDLSANFLSGALSDSSILEMDDDSLMQSLTAVKGIGMWSVHMFMLFSLHKADVLPVGDLGVRKGLQKLYNLKELPNPAQAEKLATSWQPYRSLGSWYMWRAISNSPSPLS